MENLFPLQFLFKELFLIIRRIVTLTKYLFRVLSFSHCIKLISLVGYKGITLRIKKYLAQKVRDYTMNRKVFLTNIYYVIILLYVYINSIHGLRQSI